MPALVFPAPGFTTSTQFVNTITESVKLISLGKIKSEFNTRATPSISTTVTNIVKRLFLVKESPYQLRTAKISSTSVLRSISINNTNTNRIETQYTQTSVVVTGKPTNARENLYYFNLAPGLRSNRTIVQGFQFASINLSTSTNRIETQYTQTSVVVTGKPTNARENLYYFNLAPGLRSNRTIVQGFQFASINLSTSTNGLITKFKSVLITEDSTATGMIAKLTIPKTNTSIFSVSTSTNRIETQYTQTSVVVTGKPTNARENLYYFNLAPGIRSNKTIVQGFQFVSNFISTVTNRIENQYTQTSVAVTGAPTNARENLYYFNVAPGLRSNSTIVKGTTVGSIPNEGYVFDPANLQKQLVTLRALSVSTATNRIEAQYTQTSVVVTGQPTNARENLYYFNLAPGIRSNKTIVQGLVYGSISNESYVFDPAKLSSNQTLRTTPNEGYVFDPSSINVYYDQLTIFPTGKPTNARENLYYFNMAPGLRSNSTFVKGTTVGSIPNEGYVFDPANLQKQLLVLRGTQALSATAKLSSTQIFRAIPNESYVFDANSLQKQLLVLRTTPNEGYVFDASLINKLTVPYTNTKLFDTVNIGKLSSNQTLRTTPNEGYVFDANSLQKQLLVLRGTQALSATAKLLSNQTLRTTPNEGYVFDASLINKLTVPYINSQVFNTVGISKLSANQTLRATPNEGYVFDANSLQKQLLVLRTTPNEGYVFDATSLQKQLLVLKTTPNEGYVFDASLINKLTVPYVNTEVFNTVNIGKLSSNQTLRTTPNEGYVFDANILQKQLLVLRGTQALSATAKLSSTQIFRAIPNESYVFDATSLQQELLVLRGTNIGRLLSNTALINKLTVPYVNTRVFDTVGISNLQKQLQVLKSNDTLSITVANLNKQLSKLTSVPREGYTLSSGKLVSTAVLRPDTYVPTVGNLNKQLTKLTAMPYESYGLRISKVGSTVVLRSTPDRIAVYKLGSATVLRDSRIALNFGRVRSTAFAKGIYLESNLENFGGFKQPKTASTAVELFFLQDNSGTVIRLKTGSKAIQDPAAPKKEPIQFWN